MRGPNSDDDEADLAVDVALDAVDADERARLEQRLDAAGAGARGRFEQEVDAYRRVLADATAGVAADPPPELRARVLGALDAHPGETSPQPTPQPDALPTPQPDALPTPPPTPLAPAPRRGRPGVRVLAAAAAVAALFGSGLAVGRLTAPDPGPAVAERAAGERIRELLAADDLRMQQAETADGGQVSVMYAPSTRAGALVVAGMGDPPAGHRMTVWHADPGASPRPAATMGSPAAESSGSAMLSELDAGDVLMLSLEPDGASAADGPTGPVLAEIDLR